jgi:hypothetical protein
MKMWAAPPARLSRGWLVGGVLLAFFFIGLSIYAAVQQVRLDNRLTRELVEATVTVQSNTCLSDNVRIAKAREVALADVAADRVIWTAIADAADEAGRPLPEELRATIFRSFDNRENQIFATYVEHDCSPAATPAALAIGADCTIAPAARALRVTCSP